MKFPGVMAATFINGDQSIVFMHKDTLLTLNLSNRKVEKISDIKSFRLPDKDNDYWIAYLTNNGELVLKNKLAGYKKKYKSVKNYLFDKNGKVLLIETESKNKNNYHLKSLIWVNLNKEIDATIIYNDTTDIKNCSFDTAGLQLAFLVITKKNNNENGSLWYYRRGMDRAILMVRSTPKGINDSFSLNTEYDGKLEFSNNGKRIFFKIKPKYKTKESSILEKASAKVKIWNYKENIQTDYYSRIFNRRAYTAVFDISRNRVSQIQTEHDNCMFLKMDDDKNGDYALVRTEESQYDEYWRSSARPSLYLINLVDGTRKLLIKNVLDEQSFTSMSPHGYFIIWYNKDKDNYYTYDILKNKIQCISNNIPTKPYIEDYDMPGKPPPYGIAGWCDNDRYVFIYDKYDIWKVDPLGIKPPRNITNGYGRKNKTILRVISINNNYKSQKEVSFFNEKEHLLLLSGFNIDNKDRGFYLLNLELGEENDPLLLTMGPYNYDNFGILKAKEGSKYVVLRMNEKEAPNLYLTTDFKNLSRLSNQEPQKRYNWLTSELIRWKMFDGKVNEGILYKPENFDPKRKYPVIFYFYEKLSHTVHDFIYPVRSGMDINIPYYVSNGYIVCCPDIYYKIGNPGQSAVNSVVSAAEYLTKFSWIDSTKMGLQGGSWGGYEVNYILTKSSLFKAAVSSAGASDLISNYNSFWQNVSSQWNMEVGQTRIGLTLWENPNLYIKNSPIFAADKVKTPILLLQNWEDLNVPWQQGLEWFLSLRRLDKPVWMLSYEGEAHGIYNKVNQDDYSCKMFEFFNYYLKGGAKPKWMTCTAFENF